jgi:bacillithiol system protein YtxJ
MGLFSSTKKEDNVKKEFGWISLENTQQLESILEESFDNKILIFKHSTRCSISRMALKQFENEFLSPDKVQCYYLDLLNFREVSNEIALKFNIEHQSPQLLIISNGVCTASYSHSEIQASEIKKTIY